jgi:hypothetical protein
MAFVKRWLLARLKPLLSSVIVMRGDDADANLIEFESLGSIVLNNVVRSMCRAPP